MIPECLHCGACCTLNVEVYQSDKVPEDMTEKTEDGTIWMKRPDGHCIAREAGRCSIYEIRPNVCKEFEAGGNRCLFPYEEE